MDTDVRITAQDGRRDRRFPGSGVKRGAPAACSWWRGQGRHGKWHFGARLEPRSAGATSSFWAWCPSASPITFMVVKSPQRSLRHSFLFWSPVRACLCVLVCVYISLPTSQARQETALGYEKDVDRGRGRTGGPASQKLGTRVIFSSGWSCCRLRRILQISKHP